MTKKRDKEKTDARKIGKLCFVASMGGHLEEIYHLKSMEKQYDCFLVTEKNDFQKLSLGRKTYYVPHVNRTEPRFWRKFFRISKEARRIIREENPDCIISTGALIGFPFIFWGKWKKKKIIYIESFARVHTLSLTGKLVYWLADLYIVQSEEIAKKYHRAIYGGSIF